MGFCNDIVTKTAKKYSKEGCTTGKFKIIETKTGHVFHLAAGNGETIGISEVYSSKAACIKGTESVCKNAPDAEVEEV